MPQEKYPELVDIIQAIKKYNVLNPKSTIIYGVISLSNSENSCENCGEDGCLNINLNRSSLGAVGELDDLRYMLNTLRDLIEDSVDENEYINNLDQEIQLEGEEDAE